MASDEEEGVKGNKKGMKAGINWPLIKTISINSLLIIFIFTFVLMMDAYKIVPVPGAKTIRNKLIGSLRYMPPSIIEKQTGMKVLEKDEYEKIKSDLEKARTESREMNGKVQEKFSDILKKQMELDNLKKEIVDLRKQVEEKG